MHSNQMTSSIPRLVAHLDNNVNLKNSSPKFLKLCFCGVFYTHVLLCHALVRSTRVPHTCVYRFTPSSPLECNSPQNPFPSIAFSSLLLQLLYVPSLSTNSAAPKVLCLLSPALYS